MRSNTITPSVQPQANPHSEDCPHSPPPFYVPSLQADNQQVTALCSLLTYLFFIFVVLALLPPSAVR